MSWVDILKETITQGRVKEIEDIDIDIEDDDCLRWYDRLKQILGRIRLDDKPITDFSGLHVQMPEVDEQTACLLKEDMTNKHNITTKNINMKNRAKETYEKTGLMTGSSVNRAMQVRNIFHINIYNLVDRLGEKRYSEYGETGLDLYLDWRGNKKDIDIYMVLSDEDIKTNESAIKELFRHIEQTWAVDALNS